MNNQELWQAVLSEIQLKLSEANFSTWFKDTNIVKKDKEKIIVTVPNLFVKEWLEKKYNPLISESLYNINQKKLKIGYIVSATNTQQKVKKNKTEYINKRQLLLTSVDPITNLNPKYLFDNFIVGPYNELAYAAGYAIAKNDPDLGSLSSGINYNPLFIYGDVGLGKTHLLQAIGNEFTKNFKKRARYISTEKFASELINSIRNKKIQEFKEKYKRIDLLILDDIQFLSKKEKTQEELFHIFNDLHNANKQIILSSDRLPKAIPGLEKRLASRFEGGMMADVSKPDYETRVAILKSKLDENNVDFPENVIDYLASNIQTNIREMEGALNKLIITQNLNSKTIDLSLAKKLLNKIISTVPKKNIDANRIIKSVADFYGLKKEGLFSQSKKKEVVKPRQVAMYLLRKETTMSYSGIAEKFNRKDHTTIIYACKQIEAKIENDDNYKQEIDLIKQRIID